MAEVQLLERKTTKDSRGYDVNTPGVYWVRWTSDPRLYGEPIWRANFIDYGSYLRFVSKQDDILIVEQGWYETLH